MATSMKKPLAAALSAAFLATSIAPLASAEVNPFAANTLSSGYDLVNYAHHEEGKGGEGKCGGDKADKEGKCGEAKAGKEGKCGEGKCGGDKAAKEAGGKAAKEGKCGEGKCGGDKK
jgi:uncharacterized low-complexity protein